MLRLAAFVLLAGCVTDHSETEVTVWSRLPGATFTMADVSTTLDASEVRFRVRPAFRGTTTTFRLDGVGETADVVLDWSFDYEFLGFPDETALLATTVKVLLHDDGSCVAGMTNVRTSEGTGWAGEHLAPTSACGPFGLVHFRRERRVEPCRPGEDCLRFEEIYADGTLRVGEPSAPVVETRLSDEELLRSRRALTEPALMDLLAGEPCGAMIGTRETMHLAWALESAESDTTMCDAWPLSELRALLDELVERYGTPTP